MFKDIVEKNKSEVIKNGRIKDLIKALDNEEELKKLLFCEKELNHIEHPGKKRVECVKNKKAKYAEEDEERIIKCLFYKNKENTIKHCENCEYKNIHNLEGKYFISDYQVPSYYESKGIGRIDLVISDGILEYATEIKAYKKEKAKTNEESILRMIAEILTYTYGFPKDKYKPAIAFFENTPQEIEWITRDELLNELITKANISVFLFKEVENKTHERFIIEKLK